MRSVTESILFWAPGRVNYSTRDTRTYLYAMETI